MSSSAMESADSSSEYFKAFKLLFELKAVALNPPKGFILAPPKNGDCIKEIAGALFLDQGLWMGAVVQFHINVNCLYTNHAAERVAVVRFAQQFLHPYIDIVDSSVNIKLRCPTPSVAEPGAVFLPILDDIQRLFTQPLLNLQQDFRVVNKDALKLYETHPTLFGERAAFAVRQCLERIEKAPDSMPIQFSAWNSRLDTVFHEITTRPEEKAV